MGAARRERRPLEPGPLRNALPVTGQIDGAIHMGLGYALSEELRVAGGLVTNGTMRRIGVPRAAQMPRIELHLVEEPEPEGPMAPRASARSACSRLPPPSLVRWPASTARGG